MRWDNRYWIVIIIIIIIIAVAVILYAQSYQNSNVSNNTTGAYGSANNTTNANNTVATIITIQNGAFNPNNVTIKSGTNVQWRNLENTTHQVVSDNGAFQSPNIAPNNGTWNFYFAKSGIYGYHDSFNPTETGTIIVS
jgi:plastocyanin